MLREDSRPGTLSVEITSWLHLGGLREALPVLRRNKQPLMKLHCDIMGIMKAPSSCRVPGQSLLSTMPKSALQSSGSSREKNAKVSLNYLLEVTSGTFHRGRVPGEAAVGTVCQSRTTAPQQMFALLLHRLFDEKFTALPLGRQPLSTASATRQASRWRPARARLF